MRRSRKDTETSLRKQGRERVVKTRVGNYSTKLKKVHVRKIRSLADTMSYSAIAERMKEDYDIVITKQNVGRIVNRQTWQHVL